MLTFALVYADQIVGEAVSKVSIEFRDQHPEIPWATIIGMRHRLVHAYSDIDYDILWTTVTEAAPEPLAAYPPAPAAQHSAYSPPAVPASQDPSAYPPAPEAPVAPARATC